MYEHVLGKIDEFSIGMCRHHMRKATVPAVLTALATAAGYWAMLLESAREFLLQPQAPPCCYTIGYHSQPAGAMHGAA